MDSHYMAMRIIGDIDTAMENSRFTWDMKGSQKTNYVNQVGKRHGVEQLSSEYPDVYNTVMNHLNQKMKKKQTNNNEPIDIVQQSLFEALGKDYITEATLELPQSMNIMRQDESEIIKIIKQIMKEDFKDFTVEKIQCNEGGAFYSMDLSVKITDDQMLNDMESKRFSMAQLMGKFRAEFAGEISRVLPVINTKTGSFQFTKNSNRMKFNMTFILSHTNDREWVSGQYRMPEEEAKEKMIQKENKSNKKEMIKEDSDIVPKRHTTIDPISLTQAITLFKDKTIDMKIFETALKAVSRAELERYVLSSLGIELDDEEDVEKKEDVKETANQDVMITRGFSLGESLDAFAAIEKLNEANIVAGAASLNDIWVKYNPSKISTEQIFKIINS